MRDEVITIRLTPEIKRRAVEAAHSNRRSLSNFIQWVLEQYLDEEHQPVITEFEHG